MERADGDTDRTILDVLCAHGISPADIRANIWQDEIQDVFILNKRMEVFPLSPDTCRCYVFGCQTASRLRKMGVILNDLRADEGFYVLDVKSENLPRILIPNDMYRYRPHLSGAWIRRMEAALSHRIFPYNTTRRAV